MVGVGSFFGIEETGHSTISFAGRSKRYNLLVLWGQSIKVVKHNVQLPPPGNKRAMIYASTSYQVNSAHPVSTCPSMSRGMGNGDCATDEMLNNRAPSFKVHYIMGGGAPSQVQIMRQMMPPSLVRLVY